MIDSHRQTNEYPRREIRIVFGVFAALFLVVGGLQLWAGHGVIGWSLAGVGLVLGGLVATAPRVLLPVFRVYEPVALAIGRFNTRVVMFLTFYLIISPLSLMFRLSGRDPLALRPPKDKESGASGWWKVDDQTGTDRERFRKQF